MRLKNRNKPADLTGNENTLCSDIFLILFPFRDTIDSVFDYNLLCYLNRFGSVNKYNKYVSLKSY